MLTPLQNFQMLQVFKFIRYQVAFWFRVARAWIGASLARVIRQDWQSKE